MTPSEARSRTVSGIDRLLLLPRVFVSSDQRAMLRGQRAYWLDDPSDSKANDLIAHFAKETTMNALPTDYPYPNWEQAKAALTDLATYLRGTSALDVACLVNRAYVVEGFCLAMIPHNHPTLAASSTDRATVADVLEQAASHDGARAASGAVDWARIRALVLWVIAQLFAG